MRLLPRKGVGRVAAMFFSCAGVGRMTHGPAVLCTLTALLLGAGLRACGACALQSACEWGRKPDVSVAAAAWPGPGGLLKAGEWCVPECACRRVAIARCAMSLAAAG